MALQFEAQVATLEGTVTVEEAETHPSGEPERLRACARCGAANLAGAQAGTGRRAASPVFETGAERRAQPRASTQCLCLRKDTR